MKYLSLAAIVYLVVASLTVITQAGSGLVAYMPDDAFYYLTHARTFSETGHWPSSGVHPLWAIILVPIHTPSFAAGLCALLTLTTCIAAWRWSTTDEQHLALALIFSTPGFFMNMVGGMETGILLFVMALGSWAYYRNRRMWVAVCSALLVLARLEAVALLGILYLATEDTKMKYRVLCGAVVGLILVVIWNMFISGEIFSTSARMKVYWATLYDPYALFRRGAGQAINWLTGINLPAMGIYVLALFVGVFRKKYAFVGVVAIIYVWARLEWVQAWHVVVAIPLVFVAVVTGLESLSVWRWPIYAVVVALIGVNVYQANQGVPYPAQQLFYAASQKMKATGVRYGSWNSGILEWYNSGMVTNLDGLVNDEIHPWIMENRAVGYLKKKGLRYVVDSDSAIFAMVHRVRCGFPEGLHVKPAAVIGQTREFGVYRIWEVE